MALPGDSMQASAAYTSYTEYFNAMRTLAQKYGAMSTEKVYSAFSRAMIADPFTQNRRVKHISTMPGDRSKEAIVSMLKAPEDSEQPLRSVAHGLEWTAYPYRKIRTTYQAVNTYRYYHYPVYVEDGGAEDLWREGRVLDKFNHALRPDAWARQIVGQVIQEGKVAYVPRYRADKSHNKVDFAFLQQLPSDWWKIVGFNSESKYTVMFNLMYLLQPGADWRQFGDLFRPYLEDFESVLVPEDEMFRAPRSKGKVVYARDGVHGANGRRFQVDLRRSAELANAPGSPMIYDRNGVWYYWVTLPAEKVWVFEWDDTDRIVAPPMAGLFLAFDQLSALEDVQMEILMNPLVQIAFGEIPYWNEKHDDTSDPYKLPPIARDYFETLWYEMLRNANTSGIGLYMAPVSNLHMESLQEAPNATNISTSGYAYAVQKSGLSGLIPINSDPRAGAVNLSAKIEEAGAEPVYAQMSRMMESIYRQIGTAYSWRFKMFGGFLTDTEDMEAVRKGMSNGILSETLRYLALRGLSIWEDISISKLVSGSGIMDLRLPLVNSYTMKQETSGLPPQPDNEGGRPEKRGEDLISGNIGESYESDMDSDDGA